MDIITSKTGTKPLYFVDPLSKSLEALGLFGGDREASEKNYAKGRSNFSVVGEPTYGANYVECTGGQHYLQTAIPHTREFTTLVVARFIDDLNTMAVSNYQSSNPGLSLYLAQGSSSSDNIANIICQQNQSVSGTATARSAQITGLTVPAGPILLVGRNGSDGIRRIENATASTSAVSAAYTGDPVFGPPLRLGSTYASSGFNGRVRIYGVMHYPVALTDDEITTMKATFRAILATRGVSA
eukprot:TRINITY_DN16289_c0_g1_i3.p1 TRINITY_DN16289_c0_g1~~TRINITY_DN16289_c0_g1_i3.p1  ORF type:complete len:241 (-),score=8.51 TRINITY_DN16289_c0_g1_i3:659-1381(-)